MRLLVALSLLTIVACNDAKAPEPGPPDAGMASPSSLSSTTPPPAPDPLTAATASADAGMGEDDHHHNPIPPAGAEVKITFGGKESTVKVAELPQTGGQVSLTTIIKKALPNQDPAPLKYDLVGSDGFHVGSRPACNRPLTGAEIATGKMDMVSHNVSYDAGSQLPGCYRVRAVVKIDVSK